MLLPIGHDETQVRRLPWVTFTLMALCVLTLFGTGTTSCDGSLPGMEAEVHAWQAEMDARDAEAVEPPPPKPTTPYQRWGLIPAEMKLSRLFTHQFMHAGLLHLAGNMLLLFLLGPPIEDRWGRPVFLGLYLSGGVFASLFFTATSVGSTVPLVGASGAIAAVMGAYLVRLFKSKLRYAYFILMRVGTFEAPAYLMLPLWFFGELFSARIADELGGQGGVAYWAHVGGFLYGVAFAGVMKASRFEEVFLSRRLEAKLELVAGNPIVEEIQGLQLAGRTEEAFERLLGAMRDQPEDPDVVVATWDAACALQRPHELAGALGGQIERWVADDEIQLASDYWCELTLLVPDAETDPRILLAVAKHLDAADRALEARRAIVDALRHGGIDLAPGLALRFFEIATRRAPELAAEAGRHALTWDQLPDERRRDLERQVAELEDRNAMSRGPDPAPRSDRWRGLERRGLELDLSDDDTGVPEIERDLRRSHERPEAPLPPDEDAATTAISTLPPPVPAPEPAPAGVAAGEPGRFLEIKPSEVVARALEGDGIVLARGEKLHRIPYSRIQAIGFGMVHGLAPGPVLLVDLAVNWRDADAEILQVARLRSDTTDPGTLLPNARPGVAGFADVIRDLLECSGATPLPDADADALADARFGTYPDLALYESMVFDVD